MSIKGMLGARKARKKREAARKGTASSGHLDRFERDSLFRKLRRLPK